jgi:chemotaxis response regulator CheB
MTIGGRIRILIVDDHAMFRQVVRSILKPYPNIEVVGEASDGDEAVVSVGQLKPAVVLMDVNMQKMDGVTAARLIKVQYPEVAILGLSAKAKHYDIYAMQKAGAFEVLSKEQSGIVCCDPKSSGGRPNGAHHGKIYQQIGQQSPIQSRKKTPRFKESASLTVACD